MKQATGCNRTSISRNGRNPVPYHLRYYYLHRPPPLFPLFSSSSSTSSSSHSLSSLSTLQLILSSPHFLIFSSPLFFLLFSSHPLIPSSPLPFPLFSYPQQILRPSGRVRCRCTHSSSPGPLAAEQVNYITPHHTRFHKLHPRTSIIIHEYSYTTLITSSDTC